MKEKFTNFILVLLFPKFCFGCQKEGSYLCEDCQAILEISGFHQPYRTSHLTDLYFALNYQKPLIKNLIKLFKYEPFVKDLSKTLSSLILSHFRCLENSPEFILEHFQLLDNKPNYSDFVLFPVPLERSRLKWRGFNQAEEIAREISSFLKIPLVLDCLVKTKETLPQVELAKETRKENIKGVFSCFCPEKIKGRKILLVDDVFTTGATLEEAAKVLKTAGAKEIIGLVVARG